MNMNNDVYSKVLVCERDESSFNKLKGFLLENNLIGLKANPGGSVLSVLDNNIDLGAVFLQEDFSMGELSWIDIMHKIFESRPELPIIVRRTEDSKVNLSDNDEKIISGYYSIDNFTSANEILEKHLFNRYYPSPLIHGIQEITVESLSALLGNVEVHCSTPYVVRDHIIYGEVLSLIPLESSWCRGYMMMQTSESDLLNVIERNGLFSNYKDPTFREVNELLYELTNLSWGKIKSRFLTGEVVELDQTSQTQVPIIVNHMNKYISFGLEEPHLCFRYDVRKGGINGLDFPVYQKLIFNLKWSPEKADLSSKLINDVVDSGEIELL